MGLLDDLQMQLKLEHLSELRFLNYNNIKVVIKSICTEDYDLAQWNDTTEYLTQEPMQFASVYEAREFLLNYK